MAQHNMKQEKFSVVNRVPGLQALIVQRRRKGILTMADSASPIGVVTGASGFLASWVVHYLLQRSNIRVRGTVRNVAKASHLMNLDGADARLELVEANILDQESMNAAMSGAHVCFHVASPFFNEVRASIITPCG